MDYNNKVITTVDGKKYLTIEQVIYKEKTYLYLVNEDNEKDSMFVEARDNKFLGIEPELFNKNIFPLFVSKLTAKK